jgi:hypothetical protein
MYALFHDVTSETLSWVMVAVLTCYAHQTGKFPIAFFRFKFNKLQDICIHKICPILLDLIQDCIIYNI